MATYKSLTYEERRTIQEMWEAGVRAIVIADKLEASVTSIYAELRRGQERIGGSTMDTYFVLQMKKYAWDEKHWETLDGKHYATAEEARRKKPSPQFYRVAQAYTVIRYKAVKV